MFLQSFAHPVTLPLPTLGQGSFPPGSELLGEVLAFWESLYPNMTYLLVALWRVVCAVLCLPCVVCFPQPFGHLLEGGLSGTAPFLYLPLPELTSRKVLVNHSCIHVMST